MIRSFKDRRTRRFFGGGRDMNLKNGMSPVHPGEVLREELDELGLSASALSHALGVPVNRVTMILNGQRGVRSAERVTPRHSLA